ncbi:MAG: HPr(Ser) kinase/phosphatase [Candidatus Theseobacter exili]|nr:HPr(Ser) kinase/phosphatase [Candidatus Theseobacter exili]
MKEKEMKGIRVEDFFNGLHDELKLDLVAGHSGMKRRIKVAEMNRPGLALTGFFKYFARNRVQILGKVEISYLKEMTVSLRKKRIKELFDQKIPAIIIARRYVPPQELIDEANNQDIPVFRSSVVTMHMVNLATIFLENCFARTTVINGEFVEVFGVGVLILGDSGVGKSECALGLVERGHRLISDDAVNVRTLSGNILIGSGDEHTKHHMEIRGLGIINVQTLFGAGCVRKEREIDMVVTLEEWASHKDYERLGIDDLKYSIFDVELPHIIIPVKPGRDIGLLIEVAALNHRLKGMGYHSARDFNEQLINRMRDDKKNMKSSSVIR